MSLTDTRPTLASDPQPNALALLPLAVFLTLFIGTGLILSAFGQDMAFYQLSPVIAILPAIALALALGKGGLEEKIQSFLEGAGESNIITMCMIYLLAGGFAEVSKTIGGVDAMVNLGLSVFPTGLLVPGLFLVACLVSTAMGTSMGTIAAIAPIAAGIGTDASLSAPLLMGAVVGGAMFGDNLSVISDTTIAATRTQGCDMKDKFRANFWIALPAALLALAIYAATGSEAKPTGGGDWTWAHIVPYASILVLALAGLNVFVVLFIGILLAGGFGLVLDDTLTPLRFAQDIYKGFDSMSEILILSLLMGGLGEVIRRQGGLAWLVERISRLAFHDRTEGLRARGEFAIAALTAAANVCTANNTVAIILTGRMTRALAERSRVTPQRSASLMDISSCVVQGAIPYGAQLLLAGSIAKVSPLEILPFNFYVFALATAAALAIWLQRPKFSTLH